VALPGGQIALPPQNLEILAIIPAILVAVRTRSLIGTVVAGVVSMAVLRLLFG
jgi:branched-subunit amino acid transport protein